MDSKGAVKGVWGKKSAIFVFRDFHEWLADPGVRRAFRNLAEKNRLNSPPHYRRPIVVLSPFVKIPEGVKHALTLVKFDPPSADRLRVIFNNIREGVASRSPERAQGPQRRQRDQSVLGIHQGRRQRLPCPRL